MRPLLLLFLLLLISACDYQPQETLISIKEGETFILSDTEVLIFEKLESDNRCIYATPCDSQYGEAKVRIVYQEKDYNGWRSKEHTLSTQTENFLGIIIRASFSSSYQRFTLKSVTKDANGKYITELKVENRYTDDSYD